MRSFGLKKGDCSSLRFIRCWFFFPLLFSCLDWQRKAKQLVAAFCSKVKCPNRFWLKVYFFIVLYSYDGFPTVLRQRHPGDFTRSTQWFRYCLLRTSFGYFRTWDCWVYIAISANQHGERKNFRLSQLKEAGCDKFTSCCDFLIGVELKKIDKKIKELRFLE